MMGLRFSLFPMQDEFLPLILHAVDGLDQFGVDVDVDEVSTCLIGEEPNLWEAVRVAFGRAVTGGDHVVLTATFSAGCPGEPEGDVCVPRAYDGPVGGEEGWSAEALALPARVSAQFALYPLGTDDYMAAIYGEIDRARRAGVEVTGRHFCTHLSGSGVAVFELLRAAFAATRSKAAHVVMTATISAKSPSLARQATQ
ncbi:MAG: HMP/thiamine-binding protein [Chloroflexia bacterium]|nr:HMP/thiamine-binding protein [Chloroflexia bacterium]